MLIYIWQFLIICEDGDLTEEIKKEKRVKGSLAATDCIAFGS
jgi:hypothetical protein